MTAQGQVRASGEPGAVEEARDAAENLDQMVALELPDETRRRFRTPGLQRMRFNWASQEESQIVSDAKVEANRVIVLAFQDAFALMSRIFDIVRDPQMDPSTGEPLRDEHGFVVWKREEDGWFVEDFTRLTKRQREDFIGSITTALFNWEQRATDFWADAMFAKAQFEERFAQGYEDVPSGASRAMTTVEGRSASANMQAADERYFAIYMTVLSRRADAIVRAMDRLGQRLKDLLMS